MEILYGKLLTQEEFDKFPRIYGEVKCYKHPDHRGAYTDMNLEVLRNGIITDNFLVIEDDGARLISELTIVQKWMFSEILTEEEFKTKFPEEYI